MSGKKKAPQGRAFVHSLIYTLSAIQGDWPGVGRERGIASLQKTWAAGPGIKDLAMWSIRTLPRRWNERQEIIKIVSPTSSRRWLHEVKYAGRRGIAQCRR